MAFLEDPKDVLGGAVLKKEICQKCGHELAFDLNESSLYCPPCWRGTMQLASYTCQECDCDFVLGEWCYYCPQCRQEGDGPRPQEGWLKPRGAQSDLLKHFWF